MQADIGTGPPALCPLSARQLVGQQTETEALASPRDEQAGTGLSNEAAFLASAWQRSC